MLVLKYKGKPTDYVIGLRGEGLTSKESRLHEYKADSRVREDEELMNAIEKADNLYFQLYNIIAGVHTDFIIANELGEYMDDKAYSGNIRDSLDKMVTVTVELIDLVCSDSDEYGRDEYFFIKEIVEYGIYSNKLGPKMFDGRFRSISYLLNLISAMYFVFIEPVKYK